MSDDLVKWLMIGIIVIFVSVLIFLTVKLITDKNNSGGGSGPTPTPGPGPTPTPGPGPGPTPTPGPKPTGDCFGEGTDVFQMKCAKKCCDGLNLCLQDGKYVCGKCAKPNMPTCKTVKDDSPCKNTWVCGK